MIEVLDFRKIKLLHQGTDLSKNQDEGFKSSRPNFKRIYTIFGASYPGEYLPPKAGGRQSSGSYSLSWPGIAFNFPIAHSAFSKDKDHVALLSMAAGPALSMAVFEGNSWPEARGDIFVRTPSGPRLPSLALRPKDSLPAELECAIIRTGGHVEFQRRQPSQPFSIVLNQTTPQDLISELGPPDTTHKRDGASLGPSQRRSSSINRQAPNGKPGVGSSPSSYNSTGTDTFDADFDSDDQEDDAAERAARETFWCYFSHGMDILVGPPTKGHSQNLVVSKVVIHGNVPASYAFNRHRRLRWALELDLKNKSDPITSESNFEEIKPALTSAYRGIFPQSEMNRGKVVNRTWGAAGGTSSDSSFFLADVGGSGNDVVESGGSEAWLGNTRLYTFPGLVMEVLESGAVSALTTY